MKYVWSDGSNMVYKNFNSDSDWRNDDNLCVYAAYVSSNAPPYTWSPNYCFTGVQYVCKGQKLNGQYFISI